MIAPFLGVEPTITMQGWVWVPVLVALVGGAVLAWRQPRWAIASVLSVAPLYQVRGQIVLPTTFLELYLLTVVAVVVVRELLPRWRAQRYRLPNPGLIGWALLAWTAAALTAALLTGNLREGLGLWRAFYAEPVLWFLVARAVYRGTSSRPLVIGVIAALSVVLVWTFYLLVDGRGLAYDDRLLGPYQSANFLALFCGPLLLLVLAWPERWLQRTRWVLAAVAATFLSLANSRGGQIGLFAGVAAVLPFLRGRVLKRALGIFGLVLVLAVVTLGPRLISHDGSPIARDRQTIWPLAARWIGERPLYPMAPGTFQDKLAAEYAADTRPLDNFNRQYIVPFSPNAHNLILVTWTEWGLLTVAGLLAVLAAAVRTMLRRRSYWQLVPATMLGAILAHGLVDTPILKNDLALVFMLALLLIEIVPRTKQARLG